MKPVSRFLARETPQSAWGVWDTVLTNWYENSPTKAKAQRRAAHLNRTFAGQSELCQAHARHLDKQLRNEK